ncbi:CheY-like chemotaxis protein [Neobacillus cucumis]|nr:CheY-like chemotaxis protein [Neobacillus cucumis]
MFQVDVVDNGKTGLECALKEDYNLIILDVLMPEIDGYQVLKEVRKIKKTPVIILSAKCTDEDIKYSKDLGANTFIAKPFSILRLSKNNLCGGLISSIKKVDTLLRYPLYISILCHHHTSDVNSALYIGLPADLKVLNARKKLFLFC